MDINDESIKGLTLYRYWIENGVVKCQSYKDLCLFDSVIMDSDLETLVYNKKNINRNVFTIEFLELGTREGYFYDHEVDKQLIINLELERLHKQLNREREKFINIETQLINKIWRIEATEKELKEAFE